MAARTIGRIAGTLFLLAYVVYLAGGALADSGSASTVVLSHIASHQLQISAGTLLMLANSAAVIGVGVLIFPILKRHYESSAYGYLTAQVAQGLMLAVGIIFLLLRKPLTQEYTGAHGATALPALARGRAGNQPLLLLDRHARRGNRWPAALPRPAEGNLVPRFMAVYGLAGYAIFLAGAILEILGRNVGVPCPSRAASSKSPSECCSLRKDSPLRRAATTKTWPATSRLP